MRSSIFNSINYLASTYLPAQFMNSIGILKSCRSTSNEHPQV